MNSATVLIVGDELLAGEIPDGNGPFLAARLGDLGIRVAEIRVLPDDVERLAEALRAERVRSAAVLVCGGLGPTSDDVTTEAVATAFGLRLEPHEPSWQRIIDLFARRGRTAPPSNRRQVMIPAGAEPLPNEHGTAPGYVLETGTGFVAVFPGPPRELHPMFDGPFVERLRRRLPLPQGLAVRVLRCFGLPESSVGERLREAEAAFPGLRVGYQARFPEVLVKLRADRPDHPQLAPATEAVRTALASHLYAEGPDPLPAVLGRAAAGAGRRIVVAESCTGGLAAQLLTATSGSSTWFERGFVTYADAAKIEMLGVPAATLAAHGAVSEETALAMLAGALGRSRADAGFAITGIAGPDGGTPDKPVGTTCIAWGDREERAVETFAFPWDRERNRLLSAWTACHRLLRMFGAVRSGS
jgi:nicotinamide-nucleotide amidase